jgi:transcriptional regulator with XRE-family HTH domain
MEIAMESAGFDQAKLAKVMGVAQQTVSSWITGRTSPNFERVSLFCDLTNTSTEWIIRARGPMPDLGRNPSSPAPLYE